MTKKGPLSKAEKFYIENNRDLSTVELCADLGRAKATIERFVSRLPKPKPKEEAKVENKETMLFKQFARNDKGSTVMTPNAAEMGDGFRSKKTSSKVSRCTTNIR